MLVYVVFKNDKRDKWTEISISSDDSTETTIGALAKKRIVRRQKRTAISAIQYEAPIMHLTSGELVRLLTSDAYWPLFKDFFRASRQVVTLKLLEIGDVRNSLAHFRPITEDDVEAVKQNAKQVLSSVEDALGSMIMCNERVPSDNTDSWYQELRTLGTDVCSLLFNQSTDSRWIRFTVHFQARMLAQEVYSKVARYKVINIDTPEILKRYTALRSLTIYLTEPIPFTRMPASGKPTILKDLEFTFSRPTLTREYESVREDLKQLFADIDTEAELLKDDNLAKGHLLNVQPVIARKSGDEAQATWRVESWDLRCPVENHHPTEYWGSISIPAKNLVSDRNSFLGCLYP